MGNIQLHLSKHTQGHKLIQKYKSRNNIQMSEHHRQPHKTCKGQWHSTPQQMANLSNNLQYMETIVCRSNSSLLKIRFQENIRYIRNNNPHSAFILHVLQNQQEYSQMNNIVTFIKPLNSRNMFISYEQ